jgi:hypothetical protein
VAEPANMDRTNKRFQKFNLVVTRTNRKTGKTRTLTGDNEAVK